MFREFNVKFEDVEMLGGTDNLLENTEITKVIVRGDSKMSSLDSTFKNCKELDTIDGELDLNDVSDIDNILQDTELVKKISFKNINNENISANNSFPHIEEINIGGELYNKKAIQNLIASRDWTFGNITYSGTVGDNIVTKEVDIVDDNKVTIQDTLEQKARGFEIIGQTYENLVVGSGEATLLDELTLESIDGSTNEFNPHIEQPVCVETIEGETYQNLVNGKGEYKLTDTFSKTWTESDYSIDNPPAMIEIPEIWGNTIQGYVNHLTAQNFVDMVKGTQWGNPSVVGENEVKFNSNAGGYYANSIKDRMNNEPEVYCGYTLKANTTYTFVTYPFGSFNIATPTTTVHEYNSAIKPSRSFTTDDTGRVIIRPVSPFTSQGITMKILLIEEEVHCDNVDFDLNYIESVGDLYVDENGEAILDEEGNEQYKLEIESYSNGNLFLNDNVLKFKSNSNWDIIKNSVNSFTTTQKIRQNYLSSVPITLPKGEYTFRSKLNSGRCDRFVLYLNGKSIFTASDSGNINVEFVVDKSSEFYFSFRNYSEASASDPVSSDFTFNLVRGDLDTYVNTPSSSNKTTILMPQPLRKVVGVSDRLYWDYNYDCFYMEVNIGKDFFDGSEASWKKHSGSGNFEINSNATDFLLPSTGSYIKKPNILSNYQLEIWTDRVSRFVLSVSGYADKTLDEFKEVLKSNNLVLYYAINSPQIIKTKILEKSSLETYQPKTHISVNSEIQPSQMGIVNKQTILSPLSLQASTDYTLQLDSTGKNDKPITVNLGGKTTTIQPTNDASKHHKVVVRTPVTLTTETLELSGEGVVVNDVMLFEGGSDVIKQDVGYIDGIENIGELQEDGTYKIDILSHNGQEKNCFTYDLFEKSTVSGSAGWSIFDLGLNMNGSFKFTVKNNSGYDGLRIKIADTPSEISVNSGYQSSYSGNLKGKLCIAVYWNTTGIFVGNGTGKTELSSLIKEGKLEIIVDSDDTNLNYYYEKETTQSILLPQPLNKIGDIKDKFYWDEDKGHYCIEQNVEDYIITKDSPFIYRGYKSLNVYAVLDKGVLGYDLTNKISLLGIKQYSQFPYQADELGYYINNETGEIEFVIHKLKVTNSLEGILSKLFEVQEGFNFMYGKTTPNIIDLPHLNKKYSLDTYMPTTHVEYTNSPIQPSRMLLESDIVRYKPSALETNTDYTVQFECKEKSNKKIKLNLGGSEKEVDAIVGLNHVSITTPNELSKDRLFLSGVGNKVDNVMVVKGEMNQYPEYFDGVQSIGVLQDDGTYKIEIATDNGVKNLVDTNPSSWKLLDGSVNIIQKTPIKVSPNTKYTAYWKSSSWLLVYKCDSEGNTISTYVHKNTGQFEFTTDDSTEYIISRIDHANSDLNYAHSCNLRIFEGEIDFGYEGYEKHRQYYNISVLTDKPLMKIEDIADRLYWNKSNKRYEIDRNGAIEVPTVIGDVIDLPRLYQREDTNIEIETGNIKPSEIKIEYLDIN